MEVFMFLMTVSYDIHSTPLDLLLQDKLCVNNYNLSRYFCYNLYIPVIAFWALFVGHWTDEYRNGRRLVFMISSAVQCLQALFSLINGLLFGSDIRWIALSYIPYIVSGSMVWCIAYAYVAVTTPTPIRAVRMMSLEISVALGHLLSDKVYGRVDSDEPVWDDDQVFGQSFIHLISGLSAFVAFIWSVFAINQLKDNNFSDIPTDDYYNNYTKQLSNQSPIKLLINFSNIKQTFYTAFKRRPNSGRCQLWLIVGAIICYNYVLISVPSFVDEFYEQIYGWFTTDFAQYESLTLVIKCIFIMMATLAFIQHFKYEDLSLTLIGFCGIILKLIILATIVCPIGYYLSLVASVVDWMAIVGLKSQLSSLVSGTQETGKMFTVLTILDVMVPPMASSLSPIMFRETRDSFPGTCFVFLVFVCILAQFMTLLVIYLRKGNITKESRYDKV